MPPASIYTVSQVTAYIKSLFAEDLLLADVWLSGEVSGFTQASSGHCYFTLKDGGAVLKAVIWRTQAARMVLPRNGDQVLAHGYISVYEQGGTYQLYVNHLEPAGVGRLWLEFERLKARLEAEGLFDEARKRPIPERPARVGVATSPTAAALRDILRTLAARFPLVDVILASTPVQGDAAPAGIVAALDALNRWSAEREPLDAIIVARGGGSIEELWAFNDERVARAIATSAVPVISGVGHETDFTIADFAADVRAPTPTAAAAVATPDARELVARVAGLATAARGGMTNRLAAARMGVENLTRRLTRLSPALRLAGDRQRVDDLSRRASLAMAHRLTSIRARLGGQRLQLSALDPARVLARGYAIVSKPDATVVSSTTQVAAGDPLRVRVADGAFDAQVV
ncbi:MAG: exodeoxyribonuclease VII large subunit [Anaerolineae bacterium CG2_30_64_16]|nr:MAG: exodeoxyribonuclease VII large subunit [Anaerolineae bacterium CG2_30_64_16]